LTSYTATTNQDGFYLINFASPTTFQQGAIIHKITVAGVSTNLCWIRTFLYAPATLFSLSGAIWGKNATGYTQVTLP